MPETPNTSRSDKKRLTRQRILEAAGRVFRKGGFDGAGVDGLAREAGVTSGAFYKHFDSKTAAFREAVARGMAELKEGIAHCQAAYGPDWWAGFVRYYLNTKRVCDLAESCAMQSLAPELARSDASARAAFEADLREVAAMVVAGPASSGKPRDASEALAALSMLVGSVTLARAINDPELANRIAASAEGALLEARSKTV